MPIQILHASGAPFFTIPDGTSNQSVTPLTLVGIGGSGYAQATAQNFTLLLENFAAIAPPAHPVVGQLWYDTAGGRLKAFAGDTWQTVSGVQRVGARGINGISVQGGPIVDSGDLVVSLTTTGVAPGQYSSPTIVVDSTGRITAASPGFTSAIGAISSFYMRSTSRIWQVTINDAGALITTLVS